MKRRWTGRCELATLWARWLALALCLLWQTPTVLAQTLSQTELQKLLASDPGIDAEFGNSVELSGDRALVGARSDDDAGSSSGSAYVYERGGTGTWIQVAKLTASDAAAYDYFGDSVALSGDRALIGARQNDDSGAAYVYERDGAGTWVQVAKLTTSDAGENAWFGSSVALSGDRALIGASRNDVAGYLSGSAYVYERDGTGTWVQVARLTASDAATYDFFGVAVSLSGDRALVGVSGKDDTGIDSGAAYVYERNGMGMWVQVARLTALDASERDNFGDSVELSGDRALIGAYRSDDAVGDSGSAYVYERDGTGMWVQMAKLTALDALGGDNFGGSVALSGDRALVGAGGRDDAGPSSGAAYVYERDGTGIWVQVAKLAASDSSPGNRFGSALLSGDSVALSGDWALVGATGSSSGSAYIFSVAAGSDEDEDGVVDAMDNCPADWNPLQENFDEDLLGDVCDPDDDNDGVDDTDDPFPLDPDRTLLPLILDSVDSVEYGFRFEGINSHRETLERQFDASGSDLSLSLTGYDIDTADEVRVLVNGTQIGFLTRTPNNGRGTSQLTIAQSLLNSTGNTLRFEQTNSGWRWGVTDLLLSEIGELPPLILDSVDSVRYGFRFEGINSHRETLERQFDASGSDLLLQLTGYDIDIAVEVRVLVNDTQIGFLSRTPNNGRGTSQLTIAQSLLNSTGNTLRFEQTNPGWRWGVTDLLLSDGGM